MAIPTDQRSVGGSSTTAGMAAAAAVRNRAMSASLVAALVISGRPGRSAVHPMTCTFCAAGSWSLAICQVTQSIAAQAASPSATARILGDWRAGGPAYLALADALRAEGPLVRSEVGATTADHAVCREVLRDQRQDLVQRELLLVKVRADVTQRTSVLEVVQLFRAHVVDVGAESVIIEATGSPSKLQALLDILEPFGIRELVESSITAMSRGPKAMYPAKL